VFLAKRNPPKDIVYKKITSRFFVVSSFHNDKIWYDRCNFAASLINCVLINYPAAEKRDWDGIVTRISNTLAKEKGDRAAPPKQEPRRCQTDNGGGHRGLGYQQ
jgi:hypothetical protein